MTSALDGGEWLGSRHGRFTPRERAPDTHRIEGWADPRTGLDDVEKKDSWPYRDLNSDPSGVQPVDRRYNDKYYVVGILCPKHFHSTLKNVFRK
jgi:hypothetical protein